MERICIVTLAIGIFVLSIGHCIQDVQIRNLEQAIKRTEQGYEAVLAENRKLERMNDQNLSLLSEGGWECTDW